MSVLLMVLVVLHNLSSATWEIYDPNGELVNLQVICLGHTTNNFTEYSSVIELFSRAISVGIRELVINLNSQLIVLQLNKKYLVITP